ncbi:hypothetical protein ACWGMA_30830 [Streptomyces asiaticus]
MIREQLAGGVTVLMTTQYLEEADQLADRIAVIDGGQVIADGTSDELKAKVGGERLEVTVRDDAAIPAAVAALREVTAMEPAVERHGRVLSVSLSDQLRPSPRPPTPWTPCRCGPSDSPYGGPRSTMCSSPSPGAPPARKGRTRAPWNSSATSPHCSAAICGIWPAFRRSSSA